jgi:hypothetical protein
MAEGSTPLFNNQRTGQWLTIAGGIATASLSGSQIATATLTNDLFVSMQPSTIKGRGFGSATGTPTDLTFQQAIAVITSGGAVNILQSGNNFEILPFVNGNGALNIGRYIDFHHTATATADSASLHTDGTTDGALFITGPSSGPNKVVTTADFATQTNMEAESSVTITSPSIQKFHPAHPKAWAFVTSAGTAAAAYGIYATTSGTGVYVLTLSVSMSSTNYAVIAVINGTVVGEVVVVEIISATQFRVRTASSFPAAANKQFSCMVLGDI